LFEQLVAGFAWLAANGLYIDMRRKGRSGLARIIFFWMGIPATWLWLLLVPSGDRERLPPEPEDDFDRLLGEIQKEKALGSGRGETDRAGEEGEGRLLEGDPNQT
jgi:hypothetical protein